MRRSEGINCHGREFLPMTVKKLKYSPHIQWLSVFVSNHHYYSQVHQISCKAYTLWSWIWRWKQYNARKLFDFQLLDVWVRLWKLQTNFWHFRMHRSVWLWRCWPSNKVVKHGPLTAKEISFHDCWCPFSHIEKYTCTWEYWVSYVVWGNFPYGDHTATS